MVPDRERRSRRPWGPRLGLIGTTLIALTLCGCDPYPFSPIKPQGLVARQDDNLFEIVTIIAIGVLGVVGGLIIYGMLRYRRPRAAGEPRQVFGNAPLELTWTAIPVVIVLLLFTLAVQTLQATAVPSKAPGDAVTINVIGHQWFWEYQYPQYGLDFNQQNVTATVRGQQVQQSQDPDPASAMHIPAHRTVILNITGQDVQHGWWVPALAGKNEATPGHWNHQQFIADKVGTYYAVCNYFCGIGHYNMWAAVVVEPDQASFARWVASMHPQPAPSPSLAPTPQHGGGPTPVAAQVSFSNDIEKGIFAARCAACHIQAQLGGLNLGNYQGLLKGGAVVPGPVVKARDHAHSIVWQIVQPTGPWPAGNRMPLVGPYLSDAQVQTIATWIDQGAKNN